MIKPIIRHSIINHTSANFSSLCHAVKHTDEDWNNTVLSFLSAFQRQFDLVLSYNISYYKSVAFVAL